MKLGIENRLALVTGAGRGIGRAICESLENEGVRLIAVSKGQDGLDSLKKVLNKDFGHTFISIDLENKGAVEKLILKIRTLRLSPDIIVNNAGGTLNFTDPLQTMKGWSKVMRLNVEIGIEINEAFIPEMQKKKWGRICHISSISAIENQGSPAYCASKAALNAYVRSVARYISQDNVIITTVLPGPFFTKGGYWDETLQNRPQHVKRYLNERMAIKRFGKLSEISEAVTFLCSENAGFCVGTCMVIDGGQGRSFYPSES